MGALLILFPLLPLSAQWEWRGNTGVEWQRFTSKGAYDSQTALQAELFGRWESGEWLGKLALGALKDEREEERDGLRVPEAQLGFLSEGVEFALGRKVLFHGALEVHNLVDTLNPKDTLWDPFDKERKRGIWNASLSLYQESGQLDLLLKLREEDRPFHGEGSPYRPLPPGTPDDPSPLGLSKTPTLHLSYSGYTEWALDYAVALEYGTDSITTLEPDDRGVLHTALHRTLSLKSWHTLALGSTLYKFEVRLVDGLESPLGKFYELGAGVEHTETLWGADVGLLAEYYRHERLDGEALQPDALGSVFQNDLFFGMRVALNDVQSTEFLGGVVRDLTHEGEWTASVEAERRLGEAWRIQADIRHFEPADAPTAISALGRHTRTQISLKHHF